MNKKLPKVLIISHNSLSKLHNNGKTIETIFNSWPKESIFHLYLGFEEEDFDFCSRSYRVTDYDALDNFFRIKKKHHSIEVTPYNCMKINENYLGFIKSFINSSAIDNDKSSQNIDKFKNHIQNKTVDRKPIYSFMRQFLWVGKGWFINDIFKWVEDISPDFVFFQGSGFHYSYDIVERVINKFNLPIALQLTDDYTIPPYKNSIVDKYLTNEYLKIFKRVLNKSFCVYVISKKMEKEYKYKYGGRNYIVMSNSIEKIPSISSEDFEEFNVLFAGNLGLKRYETIITLSKALDRLSIETNKNVRFKICSATKLSEEIMNDLTSSECVEWLGFLNKKELAEVTNKSNIVVHVESFDEIEKRKTRLSISTKIGEYISSGRLILALGPKDVASIEYISDKNLGITINDNDVESITKKLIEQLKNKELIDSYIANCENEYNLMYKQEVIDSNIQKVVLENVKLTGD